MSSAIVVKSTDNTICYKYKFISDQSVVEPNKTSDRSLIQLKVLEGQQPGYLIEFLSYLSYSNLAHSYWRGREEVCTYCASRFILGSFIASNIHAALLLSNCDILGVKIIRIDPLEPNIWLYYVYYAVLQLFF